jgi:hypothetical protein
MKAKSTKIFEVKGNQQRPGNPRNIFERERDRRQRPVQEVIEELSDFGFVPE